MDKIEVTTIGGLTVSLAEIRKPTIEPTDPRFIDREKEPFMLVAETTALGKFQVVRGSQKRCEDAHDTLLKAVADANLSTHFDFSGKRDALPHFSQEEKQSVS